MPPSIWILGLLVWVPSLVSGADNTPEVLPRRDWWENALIYQIYPRSFKDTNGDGIGDINGITRALPYLKLIQVDAILLAPIYKSPLNDYGYDVSDYYSVHHDYGTMDDFERLLANASELGIKVILDFVPNHTSNESEWFCKSMHKDEYYADWYIWQSGHVDETGQKKPPNNWLSVFGKSAWSYSKDRDLFYLHQYGKTQPDLNYRNPVVVEEIKNIIKFWLEKGVAGLKISSTSHLLEVDKEMYGGRYPDEPKSGKPGLNPNDYAYLEHVYTRDLEETYEVVSQFKDVFDAITIRDNMTRVMLTDAYTNIKSAVKYYGDGIHNGAHLALNFALMDDLDKESDARDIKFLIDRWLTYMPLHKTANWVTGNQDRSRVATRLRSGLVDAFNMLILLLPGVAVTYMGEEIGMKDGFISWVDTKDPLACNTDDPVHFTDVSRDPFRTPFQWSSGINAGFSVGHKTWLPPADGYETLNMDRQRVQARSHYQVYRSLATLRTRKAFRYGLFQSLALNNDVFAFKRWYHDETYIIVMNIGKTYNIVNLTVFDLVFGSLEIEVSSETSSRSFGDTVASNYLDLASDEALVLRMQV